MENPSFEHLLRQITDDIRPKQLAEVFRFISFKPGETYGPHKHVRIEINYVKRGNCILHLDTEDMLFRGEDIMIITSNVNHKFEAGPKGATLMQLEFQPDIFSYVQLNKNIRQKENTSDSSFIFPERRSVIKLVNNVHIVHTIRCIINELKRQEEHYEYMVIMHYAELLMLIYRYLKSCNQPANTNKRLKEAKDYISLHYADDINIAQIAGNIGISERHLRKLFLQYLKTSPSEYLNQVRINKAIDLLQNTPRSIKEICFRCGFKSPQYFSRIFKKLTGFSPRQITE